MVEVPVGEQHGCRPEPVIAQDLCQLPGDANARVDDDAFLAGRGRQDVAVGASDSGRKSDGEHVREPNRHGLVTIHPCSPEGSCLD